MLFLPIFNIYIKIGERPKIGILLKVNILYFLKGQKSERETHFGFDSLCALYVNNKDFYNKIG